MAVTIQGLPDEGASSRGRADIQHGERPAEGETRGAEVVSCRTKAKREASRRRVYIATEPCNGGLCKIGYSEKPKERVGAVARVSGVDLVLAYQSRPHPLAPTVENMTHKVLRKMGRSKGSYILELNTEWFRCTPQEAKKIVLRAMRLVDAKAKL